MRGLLSLYMFLSALALGAGNNADTLVLTALEAPVSELMYHLRIASDRHKAIDVSLYWDYAGPSDHYRADYTVAPVTETDNTDKVPVDCRVYRVVGDADSLVATYSSYVSYSRGRDTAMSAVLRVNQDGARIDFGGTMVSAGFDVPYRNLAASSVGYSTNRAAKVLADKLMTRYSSIRRRYEGEIAADSSDPLTGRWRYLDRDADRERVPEGIDYNIAVVAEPDSTYTIIYAGEPGDGWKNGDIKGRLVPTPFENHFDLEWYDQSGRRYCRDTSADLIVDGQVLRLNFPILGTTVRFRRL